MVKASFLQQPTPVIAMVVARKASLDPSLRNLEANMQLVARLPTM